MRVDRCGSGRAEPGGPSRVALDLRHVGVLPDAGGPDAGCVVDDVSLCCLAGTWTVLSGPPGAGAPEVLRVAAGLSPTVVGEVHAAPRCAHVGLVAPRWPAKPLVAAVTEAAGGDGDRAAGLIARLGLAGSGDRPADRLDAAARPAAALALALAGQPDLLLAADPTARMVPPVAAAARALLRESVDRTGMCVVTAEDSVAALAVADRVVLMAQGAVLEIRPLPPAGG